MNNWEFRNTQVKWLNSLLKHVKWSISSVSTIQIASVAVYYVAVYYVAVYYVAVYYVAVLIAALWLMLW